MAVHSLSNMPSKTALFMYVIYWFFLLLLPFTTSTRGFSFSCLHSPNHAQCQSLMHSRPAQKFNGVFFRFECKNIQSTSIIINRLCQRHTQIVVVEKFFFVSVCVLFPAFHVLMKMKSVNWFFLLLASLFFQLLLQNFFFHSLLHHRAINSMWNEVKTEEA